MRPPVVMTIYLVLVFLGAALVSPWLYVAAHALEQTVSVTWISWIVRHPFHRYVSRLLMIFALIGLFPFLRALGLRTWDAVGIRRSPDTFRNIGYGALLGFALLGTVALASCLAGARVLSARETSGQIAKHLLNATVAAIFASIFEELVFRGILFGGLRKRMRFWPAAFLSASVYALVHFFERPADPIEIHWNSGIIVLGRMLEGFSHFDKLVPGFFNLALLGCILALAYQRSKTLYFSMGVHAGLIFWIKAYGFFTAPGPAAASSFWSGGKPIDGWFSTITLACGLWLVKSGRPIVLNVEVAHVNEPTAA